MNFGGVDTWAIVLAAIAGYIVGAAWYMALSKPWMAAHGFTHETLKADKSPLPFILAFAANLVIATALAGVVGHLGVGQVTIEERGDFRRGVVARLRGDDARRQLQLRPAPAQAVPDRRRTLAGGVRRPGHRDRRDGRVTLTTTNC